MELLCPICHSLLLKKDGSAVCANGHVFDYGKGGYLNLLRRQGGGHGDNKEMVQARTRFLESGAYGFLRSRLQELVQAAHPQSLADLGCGEGWYTSSFPVVQKTGIDLSRDAVRHAARRDPSTQYVIASIFETPLPDRCADMVTTVFAPIADQEILRILKQDGIFLTVSPGPRHLYEMKKVLYEQPYENEPPADVPGFELIGEELLGQTFTADREALQALFLMTPYAYRTGEQGRRKLADVDALEITAQFCIRSFRRR